MPSSIKTDHLQLNRWLGGDKPKREDFVADNLAVDAACLSMKRQIDGAEGSLQSLQGSYDALQLAVTAAEEAISGAKSTLQSLSGELGTHTGNGTAHITAAERTAWNTASSGLNTHTGNGTVHITAAERTAWNGGVPQFGSYIGNGGTTRTISLGFTPKAGIIFCIGKPLSKALWDTEHYLLYCAMFGPSGASGGVAVSGTSIVLTHHPLPGLDGFAHKLNELGFDYQYIMWK